MIIQAPAFIKEGDTVRVNTETNEYLERVKYDKRKKRTIH